MAEPRHLSDAEKRHLAGQIVHAIGEVVLGVPKDVVVLATLRAAAAMMCGCANPGNEVAVLQAAIYYLQAEIERLRADQLPHGRIH